MTRILLKKNDEELIDREIEFMGAGVTLHLIQEEIGEMKEKLLLAYEKLDYYNERMKSKEMTRGQVMRRYNRAAACQGQI